MVGDTWSPTASMRTLKYFLVNAKKHKASFHRLDSIGSFLQSKVKNRVFVKLEIRYTYYFPEYAKYFGIALRLLESIYGMTNSGKLFAASSNHSVNSSANNFPELVIPYIDFKILKFNLSRLPSYWIFALYTHAWSYRFTFILIFNQESVIVH